MSIKKNILQTFLSQIPIQLFGLISGIFIARMIGPEGKGVFALYQANAQLISTFFSLSFGNALTHFIPSKNIDARKLFGLSIIIVILGSILTFILLVSVFISDFSNILFPLNYCGTLYMLWLLLFTIFSMIISISTGLLQGLLRFKTLNKILVLNSIINVAIFGILFILYMNNAMVIDAQSLLFALLIVTFINVIQFVAPLLKEPSIRPKFNVSFSEIRSILGFTVYTHLGLLVAYLGSRFNLWVINYFLNASSIGLFSLASNIIVIFNMISAPIGNVLMPFLSGKKMNDKIGVFYKYSRINFSLVLALSIVSFVISIPLIPIVYGKDFNQSVLLFQLLLPGIIFNSVARINAVFIASCNKQQYNLYATVVGFFCNVFFGYFFIKYWGVVGASISVSISYFFTFVALFLFCHFSLKMPIGNYFILSFKEIKNFYKI